jgi:molybdopterin/thiamine biosynthesis adenylyltransferase/rhodanese-related sulfurtransferase
VSVPDIDPRAAHALALAGAPLIDVREHEERAQGGPDGSAHVPRAQLGARAAQLAPRREQTVLLICAGGTRSRLAAQTLQQLGYTDARSVAGGFQRWRAEGLPCCAPAAPAAAAPAHGGLDAAERERYSRHLLLPEVGEAGQLRLRSARVLCIGAGGLGSPAALYLAAAGVGTLGLVDDDRVERSNLQRQVLHTDARVGALKVESARACLQALNPSVRVEAHALRLAPGNVDALFARYELVIDGSDNFPTRYLVNDACVKHGLPNVHGSIHRFEGQVSLFWSGTRTPDVPRGPCYRCLYPAPPPPELAPSCEQAGVLGVLPGVIGMLQAVEAIKWLLGIGESLLGRLVHYDALAARFIELAVPRDEHCAVCAHPERFPGYVDYEGFCSAPRGTRDG